MESVALSCLVQTLRVQRQDERGKADSWDPLAVKQEERRRASFGWPLRKEKVERPKPTGKRRMVRKNKRKGREEMGQVQRTGPARERNGEVAEGKRKRPKRKRELARRENSEKGFFEFQRLR